MNRLFTRNMNNNNNKEKKTAKIYSILFGKKWKLKPL